MDTLCPFRAQNTIYRALNAYWILRFEQPFGRGGYAVSLYVQSLNNAALQSQPNDDWSAHRLLILTEPVRGDLSPFFTETFTPSPFIDVEVSS